MRIELRLLIRDGSQQAPVPAQYFGMLLEEVVVGRNMSVLDFRNIETFRHLAQFEIAFGDGSERLVPLGIGGPLVDSGSQ